MPLRMKANNSSRSFIKLYHYIRKLINMKTKTEKRGNKQIVMDHAERARK